MIRISTNLFFQRSTQAMLNQQSDVSQTQLQLATGERILTPSDDPAASARILGLNGVIDTLSQYTDNANVAMSRLAQEEDAIASVTDLLRRANELAIQGNNDIYTTTDRVALASEVRELLSGTLGLSNTRDVNGEYLFSGNQTNTQAFAQTGSGTFVYQGDQGQRQLQVSSERRVADGDNGLDVFMDIDTGPFAEGTSTITAPPATLGSLDAGDITINGIDIGPLEPVLSIGARAIQLRDAINELIDTTHVYAELNAAGDGIRVFSSAGDININVATAAAADETGFAVGPNDYDATTGKRSIFSTLDMLATDLISSVSVDRYINDLGEALNHMSEIRGIIGARLNTAEDQIEINEDVKLTLEAQRSEVKDLDYAEAVARFNQQMLAYQAAQQSYLKVQEMSLFNFLR